MELESTIGKNEVESTIGKMYVGCWNPQHDKYAFSATSGIIIDKNNNIMFHLQILNDNTSLKDVTVNVFPNEIASMDYEDDEGMTSEERRVEFSHWLENKLFFFRLFQSEGTPDRPELNYAARYITVVTRNAVFDPQTTTFQVIPIINKSADFPNKDIFESYLKDGKSIPLYNGQYLGNTEDISSFIIFHEATDSDSGEFNLGYLYENVDPYKVNKGVITYAPLSAPDTITVRKIDTQAWMKAIYSNIPNYKGIIVVPNHYLRVDFLDLYTSRQSEIVQSEEERGTLGDPTKGEKRDTQKLIKEPVNNEFALIEHFKAEVRSKKYNLVLNSDDLISLYLSVKTNMLTILSGLSGTGKSKVITAFADTLGILNEDQFKMISVRPSWQDDTDLLGYADTMHNIYRPADSGLTDILIRASNDLDHMYLIVLDEMNLARIEHYFSQFLSVLEQNSKNRKIQLYNTHVGNLFNSDRYPSSIPIGINVRFVGTINTDESTFSLSDKLLDRANIIDLQMVPFSKRSEFLNEKDPLNISSESAVNYQNILIKSIINLNQNVTNNGLQKEKLDFLWELDQAFIDELPDNGFGWRTVVNIEKYVASIPENLDFSREKAFDYQIAQRILPKLRGTSEMLENLVRIEDNCLQGTLVDLLDNNAKLSEFKLSRDILEVKAKELRVTGFAS